MAPEYHGEVQVRLKPTVGNPEGQSVARGLRDALGLPISEVRTWKGFDITFEADNDTHAADLLQRAMDGLLANPVMEVGKFALIPKVASPEPKA